MNKVSVVVPTLNNESDINRLLDSILRNDIQEYLELIIVDSNSKDKTLQIADSYTFPRIIETELCSKGEARNIGVKHAKHQAIANIDADTSLTKQWPLEVIDSIYNQKQRIVAGYSPNPTETNLPRVPILHKGQDITWPCCNIAHHKSVFEDVGYFYESYSMSAEDCDFNFRCIDKGYTIHYNPRMKLYHHERPSFIKFCKQAYWNGSYRYGLQQLHPELSFSNISNMQLKNLFRLSFGALGYLTGRYRTKKGEKHSSI